MVAVRRLVPMSVMHCLTVKLCTVIRRSLAARWHGSVVALALVEMMIHVSIEVLRPMEPGSRTDKYAA
jgi:hypothetical protein